MEVPLAKVNDTDKIVSESDSVEKHEAFVTCSYNLYHLSVVDEGNNRM